MTPINFFWWILIMNTQLQQKYRTNCFINQYWHIILRCSHCRLNSSFQEPFSWRRQDDKLIIVVRITLNRTDPFRFSWNLLSKRCTESTLCQKHTGEIDSCWISSSCCLSSSRRFRLMSTNCRCRSFSASVRTSSSFIPIWKQRRNRHDEHRRIWRYRAVRSLNSRLFFNNRLRSRCRQGSSNN